MKFLQFFSYGALGPVDSFNRVVSQAMEENDGEKRAW